MKRVYRKPRQTWRRKYYRRWLGGNGTPDRPLSPAERIKADRASRQKTAAASTEPTKSEPPKDEPAAPAPTKDVPAVSAKPAASAEPAEPAEPAESSGFAEGEQDAMKAHAKLKAKLLAPGHHNFINDINSKHANAIVNNRIAVMSDTQKKKLTPEDREEMVKKEEYKAAVGINAIAGSQVQALKDNATASLAEGISEVPGVGPLIGEGIEVSYNEGKALMAARDDINNKMNQFEEEANKVKHKGVVMSPELQTKHDELQKQIESHHADIKKHNAKHGERIRHWKQLDEVVNKINILLKDAKNEDNNKTWKNILDNLNNSEKDRTERLKTADQSLKTWVSSPLTKTPPLLRPDITEMINLLDHRLSSE